MLELQLLLQHARLSLQESVDHRQRTHSSHTDVARYGARTSSSGTTRLPSKQGGCRDDRHHDEENICELSREPLDVGVHLEVMCALERETNVFTLVGLGWCFVQEQSPLQEWEGSQQDRQTRGC